MKESNSAVEEDQIDVIALLKTIWQNKSIVVKTTVAFLLIGIVVALMSPAKYEASSTFIPAGTKMESSSLGSLAALAGVNLGSVGSGSEISTSLYPIIVSSTPFKQELLSQKITVANDSVTLKEYLLQKPKGVLSKITNVFSSAAAEVGQHQNMGATIVEVSKQIKELFDYLDEILALQVNEKEGYITLTVTEADASITAQIAEHARGILQRRIIDYKTENSLVFYNYIKEQFLLKKEEFNAVQKELAVFKDRNNSIVNEQFQIKLQRLESEFNLINSVYSELAKQTEQAKLQLSKDTPVFSIIEPVVVPNQKSAPNKKLIVVIWGFLGVVLSLGFVLAREPLIEIVNAISFKKL